MANTNAQIGAGSYITMSAHGANAYSNIGPVVSFNTPNQKWSFDEITNLQSPTIGPGVFQERIPTEVDPGTITATLIYYNSNINTGYANVVSAFQSGSLYDFQTIIVGNYGANTATFSFSGYVTDFPSPKNVTVNKHLEYDLMVQLSGAVTTTGLV